MQLITSRQNPQYKEFLKISKRKLADFCLLEGERVIGELLKSAYVQQLTALLFSSGYLTNKQEQAEQFIAILPKNTVLYNLADELLENLAGTVNSQGIVAVLQIPKASVMAALDFSAHKALVTAEAAFNAKEIVLVLDNVQDPGNLGNIIRSAAAFGVHELFSLQGTVHAWQSKVLRSAMGGMFKVKIYEKREPELLYQQLMEQGFLILGADLAGENLFTYVNSAKFQKTAKVAVVLGNEGNGLSAVSRQRIKQFIKIPMLADSESLNVASAATTIMASFRTA